MDQLLAIRAFTRVVEAGSFTRAADSLNMPIATAALGAAVALSQSMTWAALMAAYFGLTAFRNLREA